mgnify:CR=1 FL=1
MLVMAEKVPEVFSGMWTPFTTDLSPNETSKEER